ncbi:MAG TPA: YncE family protein [Candidatus Binatia bacterium]|jgi:YVTN family beta-propeller protein
MRDPRSTVSRLSRPIFPAFLAALTAACHTAAGGPHLEGHAAASAPQESRRQVAIETVEIPDYGTDVAVSPDGGRAYVPARDGVTIIDRAGARVVGSIRTNNDPYALALTPDGAGAFVMDLGSRYIWALDLGVGSVKERIPVGIAARPRLTPRVAVSRDGRRLYVTDGANQKLLVLDAVTHADVRRQFLPIHPGPLALSPDGTRVYVGGCTQFCTDGQVLTIDAASGHVGARYQLTSTPSGMAISPSGRELWVANGREASVSVIDLASGDVATVPVDPQPMGVAVDPQGRRVYVASFGASVVVVLDAQSRAVVGTIQVGQGPRALAVSPDGHDLWVTHSSRVVTLVDLARVGL